MTVPEPFLYSSAPFQTPCHHPSRDSTHDLSDQNHTCHQSLQQQKRQTEHPIAAVKMMMIRCYYSYCYEMKILSHSKTNSVFENLDLVFCHATTGMSNNVRWTTNVHSTIEQRDTTSLIDLSDLLL
jgi:hypothetical protein